MRIAIRADASGRIGSGHVVRCRTLADEVRRAGAEVRFVCADLAGNLIHLLAAAGYRVEVLPPPIADPMADARATLAALRGFAPNWLVVDHYGLGEEWEFATRGSADRLCVIDDLANRRHACDLLLDHNYCADATVHRYRDLVPAACTCLLGPAYALLQPVFAETRRRLPARDGRIRRVLVFFGAVDSCRQTLMALDALDAPEFADLAVDVVVGHANADARQIEHRAGARAGTTLHRALPHLADLMAEADVMLGAGGTTTWERCCLGLPSIVAITAAHQAPWTNALGAAGTQYVLGDAGRLSARDWAAALRGLRGSTERVAAYGAAARRMTDGLGASRVAAALQSARAAPPDFCSNKWTSEHA